MSCLVVAPVLVMTVFVATVVPWMRRLTFSGGTCICSRGPEIPLITASSGAWRVEETFEKNLVSLGRAGT